MLPDENLNCNYVNIFENIMKFSSELALGILQVLTRDIKSGKLISGVTRLTRKFNIESLKFLSTDIIALSL